MNEGADIHTLVVGREAMACRFEAVFNVGEVPDATELGCAALDLVDDIEAAFSVYRDSSEVSRLNAGAAAGWQTVSEEVLGLLLRARDLHDRTGGGFDIAAGALVRAWGFLRRQGRTPTDDELAAARALRQAAPTPMALEMATIAPWHQLVLEVWSLSAALRAAGVTLP